MNSQTLVAEVDNLMRIYNGERDISVILDMIRRVVEYTGTLETEITDLKKFGVVLQ